MRLCSKNTHIFYADYAEVDNRIAVNTDRFKEIITECPGCGDTDISINPGYDSAIGKAAQMGISFASYIVYITWRK